MPVYSRPNYCRDTFDERGDGFHFSETPPDNIASSKNLSADDPWRILSCALARLQQGNFDVFEAVSNVMVAVDDLDLRLSAGTIFAFAAPAKEFSRLLEVYSEFSLRDSPELVRQYCRILCYSGIPSNIRKALQLYRMHQEPELQTLVAEYFSHVLEPEPGSIAQGPKRLKEAGVPASFQITFHDYSGYIDDVEKALASISAHENVAAGGPFELESLMASILKHAKSGEDSMRTNYQRLLFEATTGASCRGWFSKAYPPTVVASNLINQMGSYSTQHGVGWHSSRRHFFTHRIP